MIANRTPYVAFPQLPSLANAGTENLYALFHTVGRDRRGSQKQNAQAGVLEIPNARMIEQRVKCGRRKKEMRYAESLDTLQNLESIESGQDHVRRSQSEHRERYDARRVGKRRRAQAHGVGPLAPPIVPNHLGEHSPGNGRYAHALRRPGRAARGNQTDQPVRVPQRVSPIHFDFRLVLSHELFQGRIAQSCTVDADRMAKGRHELPDLFHLLLKAAVIKKPANLRIIHELDICVDCVAVIDRDPSATCAHDAEHTHEYPCIIQRIDRNAVLGFQSVCIHCRRECARRVSQSGITVANAAVQESGSFRILFRGFVEIIDRPHR
jgi:hypothetical protein